MPAVKRNLLLPGLYTTPFLVGNPPFGVEVHSDLHDVGLGILEHGIVQQTLGHFLLVPTFARDHKAMGSPIVQEKDKILCASWMARRKPG